MDTKKVVGAVVILVAVVGLVVVFMGLPATQTSFHYERQYPADETRKVYLEIDTIDTNITITFVDDPRLMYSVDVVQYEPGDHHNARYQELETVIDFSIERPSRAKSIDVVLGTGTYYDIILSGTNFNVSVVYDNGALLEGQECIVSGTGSLYFELTEDVDFSDMGLEVSVSTHVDVDLVVDLPTGLNGRLDTRGATLGTNTASGWSIIAADTWGTPSITQPLLDILVNLAEGTVSFNLND